MHFVVLATHDADLCPISNSKTKDLMMDLAPRIPDLAEKSGVRIVAGPYVNREHLTVVIVEATAEDLDRFLMEARLPQWNTIRIVPSVTIQEAMQELEAQTPLF